MKFIYFTDIHLCEGTDSRQGFAACLEAMLAHNPQLLINGGDLGIKRAFGLGFERALVAARGVGILGLSTQLELFGGRLPRIALDYRPMPCDHHLNRHRRPEAAAGWPAPGPP